MVAGGRVDASATAGFEVPRTRAQARIAKSRDVLGFAACLFKVNRRSGGVNGPCISDRQFEYFSRASFECREILQKRATRGQYSTFNVHLRLAAQWPSHSQARITH